MSILRRIEFPALLRLQFDDDVVPFLGHAATLESRCQRHLLERDHACAILKADFPEQFQDILDCLAAFILKLSAFEELFKQNTSWILDQKQLPLDLLETLKTPQGHATNSDELGGVAAAAYEPAVKWALVKGDGSAILAQSGGISIEFHATGLYYLNWGSSVEGHSFAVQIGDAGGGFPPLGSVVSPS